MEKFNPLKAKAIILLGLAVSSLGLTACGSDNDNLEMLEVNNTGIVTKSFNAIEDWNQSSIYKDQCTYNEGDRITTGTEIEFLSAPATRENMYDGWVIETTGGKCDTTYPTLSQLKDNVKWDEPKK